jgi:putative flippase GtrA
VLRFGAIGAVAGLCHYCVALLVHAIVALTPAWSNLLGFSVALPVSYFGHRNYSFCDTTLGHRDSLPRFLATASGGFVLNQLVVLIETLYLPFWVTLGLALGIVAVVTYLVSRHWAFR